MFQSLRHAAEQGEFIKFLSSSLNDNNGESITNWVRDKLLNNDESTRASKSTREAFFEAEKILINSYIKAGNVDEVITLINAINGNNNQLLRKYECDLLLLSLKEQQHVLHSNPGQRQKLQEFLQTECDKLEESHKQEISNKVSTFFSNLGEVQQVGKDVKPKI